MMDERLLGERLAALAAARNLDVTALSRGAGLKEGAVYKLLRGDQKTTSFQTGLRLARLLQVDPWELAFGGATEVEPDDSRLGGVERALSELQTQVDHLQATIREAARKGAGLEVLPIPRESIDKSRATVRRTRKKAG